MGNTRRTHYDEMGLAPKATAAEIERAQRKYVSDMAQITAAPDPRRAARMKAAYETLSDPVRRAQYDALIAAPVRKHRAKGLAWLVAGLIVLAGAAAGAYLLRPPPPPPLGTLGADAIRQAASRAMARVESTDISGKASPIGLAFAIDENVMATSCTGITPMSQLTVRIDYTRVVPARVAQADEKLGVCKLSVHGVGGAPLAVTGIDPKPGDLVYATKMNANGEVGLVEAKVKSVTGSGVGRVVDISVRVLPERQGGPVLDTQGRVLGVGVVTDAKGASHVVGLTDDWARPPKPVEAPPSAAPAPPVEAPRADEPKALRDMPPERRERLEKAFRPPPNVD